MWPLVMYSNYFEMYVKPFLLLLISYVCLCLILFSATLLHYKYDYTQYNICSAWLDIRISTSFYQFSTDVSEGLIISFVATLGYFG